MPIKIRNGLGADASIASARQMAYVQNVASRHPYLIPIVKLTVNDIARKARKAIPSLKRGYD
jgi:hypothetical protein